MSSQPEGQGGFVRAIGLFPATALNMSQMVGIGPFITIPPGRGSSTPGRSVPS